MPNSSLTFASLFSGCGGFDLGFLARGFRSEAAYDNDPDAVANFRANIGGSVIEADLNQGIPNEYSLPQIDVLIAGPPCQGFSTVGKRNVDDERNHLLTLTGHLALRLQPKVLIVENVAGALAGAHSRYWTELDGRMRLAGYRTNTIRCQASELGMAQLRKRVLFFAWRTKRDIQFALPRIAGGTLRDALKGISKQKNHAPQMLSPGTREYQIAQQIKPGQKLSNVRGGVNAVATWDVPGVFGPVNERERTILEMLRLLRRRERTRTFGDADPVSLPRLEAALGDRFHKLVEGLIAKNYLRRVDEGIDLVGTFNGKFRRLDWDKPSCTVDTRFGNPRYFLHPSKHRGFSVREAARIQGFSDNFAFHGRDYSQFRLIGNAVPPPLGAMAADIARRLLGRAS